MSKTKKYKIKPVGKPKSENVRQTSEPRTPEEKVQALADNIEGQIYAYNIRKELKLKIDRDNMRVVQGVGVVDLKDYKQDHESEYKSGGKKGAKPSETAPELKKVSKDRKTELPVNDPKFFKDSKKPQRQPQSK
ncbi:MAG: hypothetical protein QNJ68_03550 [Microcoleaceae cyanobacterium MO_207.B10]|nr:hypothetical protein [Microcoleaceae cyanobacterium MO_207.B10]